MKKVKVIDRRNLPVRPPVALTISCAMALDYYHVPDIIKGIIWAILALIWLGYIIGLFTEKQTDLFESDKIELTLQEAMSKLVKDAEKSMQ